LELCYAPPFSSAKDPVNMAGYVAENVLAGRVDVISAEGLLTYDKENTLLLDVRTGDEFNNGHLEGAVNIPVDSLRDRIGELDKSKEILEYCQIGLRGYVASRILTQNGFKVRNIDGGYKCASMLNFKPIKVDNSDTSQRSMIDSDTQVVKDEVQNGAIDYHKSLDACGLCCPGPLIQVKAAMDQLSDGQILRVSASDPGFYEDIKTWCSKMNNELVSISRNKGMIQAFIKKNSNQHPLNVPNNSFPANPLLKDNKTIVIFSGDLDKALASFIIANGAVAMGKKVTMFFTFWGLNILRKHEKVPVKKSLIESMFGFMMPRGSKKLKLSKMNMMGLGGKMIKRVMNNKNISSLEDLIKMAIDSGVEVVACSMTMDLMGLKQEELLDGIKIGGVGYYLGEAEESNVNLFI